MKKVLIILILGLFTIGCDGGGILDPNTVTRKPEAVYRLAAAGLDLRVYEFPSITIPNKQCIFVAGERKAGLQCFDTYNRDPK